MEDLVYGALHLEEYSTHDSWMIATHGGFVDDLDDALVDGGLAWMMLWLMEAWLG